MSYTLYKNGEEHIITIAPVNAVNGVFSLVEGDMDIGDIVFDDRMNQWEYTGMGDLTHKEAGEIAEYIKQIK